MKWDPDKAVALLEKWTGVSGLTTFTKRYVPAALLLEFGLMKPGEEGMVPIWELSHINDKQRYFFGRTMREAFLMARRELRPKHVRKRKVDRPARPAVEES